MEMFAGGYMQIAIDGPAGAGKSTVAKKLSLKLNCQYIDTGAMYRATVLLAKRSGLDLTAEEAVASLANNLDFEFQNQGDIQQLLVNGVDVTEAIREPLISQRVSQVAAFPRVRQVLVAKQQALAASHDVVMEGRDIGEIVLPQADFKFFVTASIEIRAQRRYKELINQGFNADLDQISEEILRRDENDQNRAQGALKQLPEAIYIDTSGKTIDQVVHELAEIIQGDG